MCRDVRAPCAPLFKSPSNVDNRAYPSRCSVGYNRTIYPIRSERTAHSVYFTASLRYAFARRNATHRRLITHAPRR